MSVETTRTEARPLSERSETKRAESTDVPPFVVARATVSAVTPLSPSFVRVTFAGEDLREFATPGAVFDLRIKLIFPPASGVLPRISAADGWYQGWVALPEHERGSMRTYSIRDIRVVDGETEIDVDFVLHLQPGLTGPASTRASQARVGQELVIAGPRRGRDWGGIEFSPAAAPSVVLAGDETAAPAIARIIEDSPALRGVAFIEVPSAADVLPIATPAGFSVRWFARAHGEAHGTLLIPAVLDYLGTESVDVEIQDVETEELLWETPVYSGLGEQLATDASVTHATRATRAADGSAATPGSAPEKRYFWIAGESGVVTTLRRHLVKDLGIDRTQVAFMGYWRRGVAMRG